MGFLQGIVTPVQPVGAQVHCSKGTLTYHANLTELLIVSRYIFLTQSQLLK